MSDKDNDGVVRLSLHFRDYDGMKEWLDDVCRSGAFGSVPNELVPSVMEPRKNIGIREFDGIDERKTSAHYTLDNALECRKGKTLMEVFKEDADGPPLFI